MIHNLSGPELYRIREGILSKIRTRKELLKFINRDLRIKNPEIYFDVSEPLPSAVFHLMEVVARSFPASGGSC
jgi:hypothetical protein